MILLIFPIGKSPFGESIGDLFYFLTGFLKQIQVLDWDTMAFCDQEGLLTPAKTMVFKEHIGDW